MIQNIDSDESNVMAEQKIIDDAERAEGESNKIKQELKKAEDLAQQVFGKKDGLPRNEIRNGLLSCIPKFKDLFSKKNDPKSQIVIPSKKIMKKLELVPTIDILKPDLIKAIFDLLIKNRIPV